MTPTQLSELENLCLSLEEEVRLCTTRVQHIRAVGHANRARRLLETFQAASSGLTASSEAGTLQRAG